MTQGRPPLGPNIVEHFDADPNTKLRLQVMLQTLAGAISVPDACLKLGISQPRFFELRATMLQAALDGLQPKPAGQSVLSQRHDSDARQKIRIAVVAFRQWITRFHPTHYDPAALLELDPRTLARWHALWLKSKLRSNPRGRPMRIAHVNDRNQVIHLLDALGPHVGCSTLQLFFPLMARRPLRRLLQRYRRIWRKRNRLRLHELHWHRPGSVWAIDYTQPPAPVTTPNSSI